MANTVLPNREPTFLFFFAWAVAGMTVVSGTAAAQSAGPVPLQDGERPPAGLPAGEMLPDLWWERHRFGEARISRSAGFHSLVKEQSHRETSSPTTRRPERTIRPNDNPNPFLNFDITGTPRFAGDVNGDGINDYLYRSSGARDERTAPPEDTTGKSALYLGTAEPSQDPDQTLYASLYPVGDLNADGHDDALALAPDGRVTIYAGGAAGYQATEVTLSPGSAGLIRGFTDLDGDGYEDALLSSRRSGVFDVVFGATPFSAVERRQYTTDGQFGSYMYSTANLTGGRKGSIVRLAGVAPKMRVDHLRIRSDRAGLVEEESFIGSALQGRAGQQKLSLVDVSGNGSREIVTTAGGDAPMFVFSRGAGGPGGPSGFQATVGRLDEPSPLPLGDLDTDGSHDFYAYATVSETHTLFYGGEGPSISGRAEIPYGPTTFGGATFVPHGRLGDLNGDGFDDTVLNHATYREPHRVGRRFLFGEETRRADMDTVSFPRRHVFDRILSTTSVGDMNVGGVADVAVPFFDRGQVGIYFGEEDTEGRPDKLLSVAPFPYDLAKGDYNGDDVPDLAVAAWGVTRQTSQVQIYLGRQGFGGGVTTQPDHSITLAQLTPSGYEGGFYQVATAGDVNEDGRDDLLVSAPFSVHEQSGAALNRVYLFHGGAAALGSPNAIINYRDSLGRGFLAPGYRLSGIGDFDGDGVDDFAIGVRNRKNDNGTTGAVHVFYGGQNARYTGADLTLTPPAESSARGFSFGLNGGEDVNGDGAADLLVAPSSFPSGAAMYAYYGGAGPRGGDVISDARYVAPVELLGPRAEGWDRNGDGLVDRNHGSITLGDFNQDDSVDVVLNTGFAGTDPLSNALLYRGGEREGMTIHRPNVVLEAPNSATALGGAYGAAAGDFTGDGAVNYFAVQNWDGNEAYASSRLHRYRPYDASLESPSSVEAQRVDDEIVVSWEGPASDRVAGYYLYRGDTPNASTRIDSVGAHATSATDTVPSDTSTYFYRVAAVDVAGQSGSFSPAVKARGPADRVSFTSAPNPARSFLKFEYTLPEASAVELTVYDLLGRRVVTLDQGEQRPGAHTIQMTRELSPGVYFGRLRVGERTYTEKVTVVR